MIYKFCYTNTGSGDHRVGERRMSKRRSMCKRGEWPCEGHPPKMWVGDRIEKLMYELCYYWFVSCVPAFHFVGKFEDKKNEI